MCLLVMELAAVLEERGLALTAEWAPREWNAEADALTNSRFEGFNEAYRVHFDMSTQSWRVLDKLLQDGRAFYAAAQAARAAARLGPMPGRRKSGGRRVPLKESDPW